MAAAPRGLSLDTHVIEVLPLFRPLALREPVVNHFLWPGSVHCCGGSGSSGPAPANQATPLLMPPPRPRPQAVPSEGKWGGEEGNPWL